MILVDTSVWIDDIRRPIRELRRRVETGNVVCHEMVIGELACGNLPERNAFLRRLSDLPAIPALSSDDVLALIDKHAWMGRGIAYVDANLLGSALARASTTLWTHDKRLQQLAEELGIAHTANGAPA